MQKNLGMKQNGERREAVHILAQASCLNVTLKRKARNKTENTGTIIRGPCYTQHICQICTSASIQIDKQAWASPFPYQLNMISSLTSAASYSWRKPKRNANSILWLLPVVPQKVLQGLKGKNTFFHTHMKSWTVTFFGRDSFPQNWRSCLL